MKKNNRKFWGNMSDPKSFMMRFGKKLRMEQKETLLFKMKDFKSNLVGCECNGKNESLNIYSKYS